MFQKNTKEHELKLAEEVIRNNFKIVAGMKPVKYLNYDVLKQYEGSLLDSIKKYFKDLDNNIINKEYGKLSFYNTSAKDLISHSPTELKIIALGALKEVLENGKVLYYKTNYKQTNKDRMDIVAPIVINYGLYTGDYMMGVGIVVTESSKKVSLVEIIIEGELTNGFDACASPSVINNSPSMINVLQEVIAVKNGKLSLDQVTAIGIDSE